MSDMIILIGILLIIGSFLVVFLVFFEIVPKKVLKFKYDENIKEGYFDENKKCYIAEQMNMEAISTYSIVKDRYHNKTYAKIICVPGVKVMQLYIYCFNKEHQIIKTVAFDQVTDLPIEKDGIFVSVPNATEGLYVQLVGYDGSVVNDNTYGYLNYTQIVIASLILGIMIGVFVGMFSQGFLIIFFTDHYFFFPGIIFLYSVIACILGTVASYFVLLHSNKKYLQGRKAE